MWHKLIVSANAADEPIQMEDASVAVHTRPGIFALSAGSIIRLGNPSGGAHIVGPSTYALATSVAEITPCAV